jgi:hypothetical protein
MGSHPIAHYNYCSQLICRALGPSEIRLYLTWFNLIEFKGITFIQVQWVTFKGLWTNRTWSVTCTKQETIHNVHFSKERTPIALLTMSIGETQWERFLRRDWSFPSLYSFHSLSLPDTRSDSIFQLSFTTLCIHSTMSHVDISGPWTNESPISTEWHSTGSRHANTFTTTQQSNSLSDPSLSTGTITVRLWNV